MPHGRASYACRGQHTAEGRSRRAEQLYRQALAERPNGPEALTGLAYTQLDRGQTAKAIALFKQALGAGHAYPPALFGLGEAYREEGNQSAAVDAFKQYLAARPSGRESEMAKRQIRQLAPSTAPRG